MFSSYRENSTENKLFSLLHVSHALNGEIEERFSWISWWNVANCLVVMADIKSLPRSASIHSRCAHIAQREACSCSWMEAHLGGCGDPSTCMPSG